MATILFNTGAVGAIFTIPAGYTALGGTNWITELNANAVKGIHVNQFNFGQIIEDAAPPSHFICDVEVDLGSAGATEIAACAMNTSQSGFAMILASGGLVVRKETATTPAGNLHTSSGHPTTGTVTLGYEYDTSTNDLVIKINGSTVATVVYDGGEVNLRPGIQSYDGVSNSSTTAHPSFVSMTSEAFGPATSIDTLTTDGSPGLVVGQPFAMTTTGLGTITSITITTAATPTATTTATSLSLPSGDGTAAARSWVDAEFYAFPGTVTVVASDGTLTATGSYTLSMPDDYLDVVFADVETTDDTYIGTKLDDLGHPLEDGDIGYYPVGNGLAIGTNGHISCDGAMTFVLWIQKLTGVMEMYNVTVNDAGEITGATGITSRGITSRGITTRNITSRGIT